MHLNKAVLIGTVAHPGVELRYTGAGLPLCVFTLEVNELFSTGAVIQGRIPCEVAGKQAETYVGRIHSGDTVLVEGRVRYRSGSGLVISAPYVTFPAPHTVSGDREAVPMVDDDGLPVASHPSPHRGNGTRELSGLKQWLQAWRAAKGM
jgi:primosomal replication protein N